MHCILIFTDLLLLFVFSMFWYKKLFCALKVLFWIIWISRYFGEKTRGFSVDKKLISFLITCAVISPKQHRLQNRRVKLPCLTKKLKYTKAICGIFARSKLKYAFWAKIFFKLILLLSLYCQRRGTRSLISCFKLHNILLDHCESIADWKFNFS